MDVKWLFLSLFAALGVFRASRPVLFNQWVRLRWSDLDDSRFSISSSTLGALLPGVMLFIIFQGLSVELSWWKAPVGITLVLCARFLFSALMSLLFSGSSRIRINADVLGGVSLSLFYAVVAFIFLCLILINKEWSSYGIYLLGAGHLCGLLWSSMRSPVLQNIRNAGSRFYAMSYLCTLELVLIFSFVN